MNSYEIFITLHPHTDEKDLESFVSELEGHLAEKGITINKKEVKTGERLAYPIKHQIQGHMVKFFVSHETKVDVLGAINELLAAKENILRRLVFSQPKIEEKKEKEPVSVIDQLRKQEKITPKVHQDTSLIKNETTPKKEETDIKEIDKKIEELLT